MAAQHIQVLSPLPIKTPPGAMWAGQGAAWLAGKLRAAALGVWRALEAHGERRAARELHSAAQRWDRTDPARARALRLAGAYLDPSLLNRSAPDTSMIQHSKESK
jgi:hypothetical protein